MRKRIVVHKNHILLTLFFNLIIMIAVACIAAGFLATTALRSFIADCNKNDEITGKLAKLVEKQMQDNEKYISIYGNQLYLTGDEADTEIEKKLILYGELGTFDAVYFMKQNGQILSTQVDRLKDINQNKLYQDLLQTVHNNKIYRGGDTTLAYSYHVNLGNENKGWVLGIEDAVIKSKDLGEDLNSGRFYVLDENKNVLLYSGGANNLNYNEIKPENFYTKVSEDSVKSKQILKMFSNMNKNPLNFNGRTDDFTVLVSGFKELISKNNLFWYEKEIDINKAQTYTVLYGKAAYPSDDTIKSVTSGLSLIGFLMVVFFILLVILLVSQASSNRRIAKMAYLDLVINWPNWNKFRIDAKRNLKRHKNNKYAMVSMDIKQFRIISELDGYQKGEDILRQITGIFKTKMRKGELFTRFSIDNFVLLLCYVNEDELIQHINILDSVLVNSMSLKGMKFKYGIYYVEDYTMDVDRMYAYSTMAKDIVKNQHDDNIGIFNENIRNAILKDKELEGQMDTALANHEFLVYLQPKYSADGERIAGAEALVRWNSKTLGFISPGEFIPLFEKNGFITSLDNYMLNEVCKIQKEWLQKGNELVTISVNLSRAHLLDRDLTDKIKMLIDKYQLPYDCIELELTESAFFDDKEVILSTVSKLRVLGIKVSMDDFGTGYSSLNSLKNLSLDVIKLDRDFFLYNDNAERGQIVIKDTIALAKHLNMEIVAEGIETEDQVNFLRNLGCDMIQGFYFAKPMPVNEFEKLMGYANL